MVRARGKHVPFLPFEPDLFADAAKPLELDRAPPGTLDTTRSGRFAAAPASGTAPAVGLAPAKLVFPVTLYASLARAELSALLALWAMTQRSASSSLQGHVRIAHGYAVGGTTMQ